MTNCKLGIRKADGVTVYITDPEWVCDWYWAIGYLGNRNEHYHLKDYQNTWTERGRNLCMYDALKKDYTLEPNIYNNLWTFCELYLSAYTLTEAAGLYNRGGAHMTTNPCMETLQRLDLCKEINEVQLPAIFAEIKKIHEVSI
jgi:hypothetical protein